MFGWGKKKLPTDVEALFNKLHSFLKDDEAQLNQLPSTLRDKIKANPACDAISGATGQFGRCLTNPVPVNGPLGEALYLSSLRLNGHPILFHRLGSVGYVDLFEVVSMDAVVWDLLFLTPYYPRKSRHYPIGFKFAEQNFPLTGTTSRVQPFPHSLYGAIRNFSQRMVGMPMPNPEVRKALEDTAFVPPEIHRALVAEILHSRITVALTDDNVEKL